MTTTTTLSTTTKSTLASLRALTPQRFTSFSEALQIAELQATKLTELVGDADGIREHHIAELPRITICYEDLTVSGMSHWNGQQWVISIRKDDSLVRQRFTILHEFKHIIDHGRAHLLYADTSRQTASEQAEAAADYFAGCTLVGKRQLKRVWGDGTQKAEALAAHFGVSVPAIRVRLHQTGLDVESDWLPAARCARPITTKSGVQRFRTVRPRYTRRSYA